MFENMLLDQLSKKLGKKVTAEELKFNQFTGEIEIKNLVVYNDMEGTGVLATLASGHAKLNVSDLLQKKVNISFASVDNLSVNRS